MRDLYAVGEGTFLDELLTIAGGVNIVQNAPALYPKVSREFIISNSPEVIIISAPSNKFHQEGFVDHNKNWQDLTSVRAIKNNQIHYVIADYILIPGPRLVKT